MLRVDLEQSKKEYQNLINQPYEREVELDRDSEQVIKVGYVCFDFSKISTGRVVFEQLSINRVK